MDRDDYKHNELIYHQDGDRLLNDVFHRIAGPSRFAEAYIESVDSQDHERSLDEVMHQMIEHAKFMSLQGDAASLSNMDFTSIVDDNRDVQHCDFTKEYVDTLLFNPSPGSVKDTHVTCMANDAAEPLWLLDPAHQDATRPSNIPGQYSDDSVSVTINHQRYARQPEFEPRRRGSRVSIKRKVHDARGSRLEAGRRQKGDAYIAFNKALWTLGCVMEVVGYGFRTYSHKNPFYVNVIHREGVTGDPGSTNEFRNDVEGRLSGITYLCPSVRRQNDQDDGRDDGRAWPSRPAHACMSTTIAIDDIEPLINHNMDESSVVACNHCGHQVLPLDDEPDDRWSQTPLCDACQCNKQSRRITIDGKRHRFRCKDLATHQEERRCSRCLATRRPNKRQKIGKQQQDSAELTAVHLAPMPGGRSRLEVPLKHPSGLGSTFDLVLRHILRLSPAEPSDDQVMVAVVKSIDKNRDELAELYRRITTSTGCLYVKQATVQGASDDLDEVVDKYLEGINDDDDLDCYGKPSDDEDEDDASLDEWEKPGETRPIPFGELMRACRHTLPSSTTYISLNCLQLPESPRPDSFGSAWQMNHGVAAKDHVLKSAKSPQMRPLEELFAEREGWYLLTSPFAITEVHADPPGWLTYVECISGYKVWTTYPEARPIAELESATHLCLQRGTSILMLPNTAHSVYTAESTLCRGFHFINYRALGSIDVSLRASSEGSDKTLESLIFATQIDSCLHTLTNRPEPKGVRVAREDKVVKVMAKMTGTIDLARRALYTWQGVGELGGWRAGR
ncbi:hypothetical protein HD553DRAFT_325491 [Filobasidium floriforme]|uniref:uncharacterized protein n=1 Tax=Filobasidium floriforme TaxID=5210 RepID=UPI001E8D9A67|nr:uncharacterized protein HD553DRAFT_325491 [Filobasidium floriforme]KAH8081471.1 hypothetical protein HD553DRAFT_325491 [Filobasidium floriforme]